MTMDRVHHQHGFQQPSQQQQPQQQVQNQNQQQHHQQAQSQPQHHTNLMHALPNQHLYRHNNHQNQLLLHHHHHHHQHHHHSLTTNTTAAPPIPHRPIHPPPPPPPPPLSSSSTSHQRFLTTSSTNDTTPEPPSNALVTPNISSTTTSIRSATDKTDHYHSQRQPPPQPLNVRNSIQHNYYVNTPYQPHYQPSNRNSLTNYNSHHVDQQYHHQHQQLHNHHNQLPPQPVQNGPPRPPELDESPASVADSNVQDPYFEEVIQAILSAKDALEKLIQERDERDIMLIDNLCSLVHGFDIFPKSVRRALAAQAVLIVIDEKGKELIVHNEELDSFCVLIFGECVQLNVTKTVPIRYYHVGDSFGVCEPTTETIRFNGHMITRCENCAFLCVKRDDFYTILTDPANYTNKELIRHRDRNGNVICVSQFHIDKKSSGPPWSNHMQTTNPFKIVLPDAHTISKATEAYLLYSLVDGYDRVDPEYVDDFLLLFRVFMTHDPKDKEKKLPPGMIKLCLTLAQWLENTNHRDKVVKIILTWLSSYHHDFELNPDFSYLFFRVLESRLLNLAMNNQLHLLHVTLSTKSRTRHVTISRSSREQRLTFSISGGYEKNCGIFVTQVDGSSFDDCPHDNLLDYLKNLNLTLNNINAREPRHRTNSNSLYSSNDSRISVPLRPGDQILEVNGTNFAAIKLVEAQKKLDMSTHLSLTVKYNPSEFHEMRALPEGRRKSSQSSIASVSPYQPSSGQSKFTFTALDQLSNRQADNYPPPSPLFSSNASFGFKSIIKAVPRGDRSRLSSLINSSKQFVKQIRDSTVQSSSNNLETMSKTSDNVSDDQSNHDLDIGKAKSNPDLPSMKNKDRLIESGLSNIVRLDDLNPASITEQPANGSKNQLLVNVLRVFNAANNEFRYLLIHEETTAREVVMVAVREFNLAGNSGSQLLTGDKSVSSLNWHLYEVSVVPESKTIKQKCLSEQTSRLAERASLCSRFYIKNNTQSSFGPTRLDMGDDALVSEILKESPANITLTSLNATLLAVELTLTDFDKFRGIEPQQFVYDTFFNYSERDTTSSGSSNNPANGSAFDSASLKSSSSDGQETDLLHAINKSRSIPKSWMQEYQEFADISNKEMFWVVCEILNERNISRRVKIVKQFVRVADVCSQLRNYNSMFAIISGLGHSCVNRLRRTFDKLKPKYKNQLEKMRNLFDPSKNMSNYRICLGQTPPPAIPLFPQIKKDLTFTKEGRSIFIRESNDLSDDDDSYSQDTIKRKSRSGNLLSIKSNVIVDQTTGGNNRCAGPIPPTAPPRSISYTAFNNRTQASEPDSILVNFAEIRQFTERVRNVIYFSSVPYSNDLLTNTKDNQRNQAQIKKMHEEWQMRKRIRHYINQTLDKSTAATAAASGTKNQQGCVNSDNKSLDQTDGSSSSLTTKQHNSNGSSKVIITYNERALYQRSLDVEPELNTRPTTNSSAPERHNPTPTIVLPQQQQQQLTTTNSVQVMPQIQVLPQVLPPTAQLNMHPPPSVANSSPTLSKSSSLSSCSSFNHHLPNYHVQRSNLTTSVGKFGTESTESLRKLQALSENMDDWRRVHQGGVNGGNPNSNIINSSRANSIGDQARGLVPTRIFPPKGSR